MMLIYSVIYLLLAIYIERVNPGQFGVAQPWNYLFKKSYWKPQATGIVQPVDTGEKPANKTDGIYGSNQWIELSSMSNKKTPSLTVSNLTKVNNRFFLSHV
jgi:ATP-binding cassette subfamily A (ABC1) protein 3